MKLEMQVEITIRQTVTINTPTREDAEEYLLNQDLDGILTLPSDEGAEIFGRINYAIKHNGNTQIDICDEEECEFI